MFKSADERAADRREREAEEAREAAARAERAKQAQQERERRAFLATPLGAATLAKEAGQAFLEVQMEVGAHVGEAGFGSAGGQRTMASSAATLEQIEKLGWRLEHASYVFMVTGESSSARLFASGEATAVSGVTVGVYLFRNTASQQESASGICGFPVPPLGRYTRRHFWHRWGATVSCCW